jgi:formate dehydrogenase alpha subunit
VAGLATSFGSGAMTNTISELGSAAAILAIGTNTTAAHPIVALQVKSAARNGSKLIVANPKEIELCRFAHIFLQHKPGTDVPLLMGLMRVILDEELQDKSFIESRCENFEAFKKSLAGFDLDSVEKITGVPGEKIVAAARCYASEKPAAIIYCMGITQHVHGTDNVLATSNLAMLTGNIGKPSSGVNPLRGQSNVQGACDMGCLPNVYPGYQAVTVPENKTKFESAWGRKLSDSPGLTHTEIFDAVHSGKIKALYLVGENPVLSEANASHATEAMEKADFLVVQDIFLTETAQLADVVLPAATFAEKEGTFTNTERRVQRVREVIKPVGDAKPDWWITCQIAKRLGGNGFDYSNPEQVMEDISSLVPSYHGITYERLDRGSLQWPCPSTDHPGTPILHTERFATDTGKGKFMPLTYRKPGEEPDEEYPLLLTTDRSLYHFHGTMTRRVYGLNVLNKEELLNINPQDATRLGITDNQMVQVVSRRGAVKVKVMVTDTVPSGTVSMSFHFAETRTNVLTCCELDVVAKTPSTKVCAVRIEMLE